ncbi:ketopantoate reductase family protein [Loktanella sp. M215]|uniref:ketopantoate reductase family protein n=1 Tax=Loktanella sp. M215 TaxID=2675431 RepID=UPI001F9C9B59|nr:ketopantoate reductase family protein [Loktanella sp. M215]MCF7699065.1 2-dehydropantoate 2-reductase [Loktanella sp. M215]
MKIAVLGAGAMGSVYGARLARAGADVTLLDVNADHVAAVSRDGLRVAFDEGEDVVQIRAMSPDEFVGPADLILLFTKVFHTDAALAAIADRIGNAWVLSLQNGVGNAERIAAYVSPDRILVGMTMTPAEFIGPGHVASHGAATTDFYTASGHVDPILDRLANLLQAGRVTARINPDIHAAIWEKAAFNCALNPICALTNGTPGSVGASKDGRALADAVVAEAIAVAKSCGVTASRAHVDDLLAHAYAYHLMHEPSMLQDIKAQRRTEIDALNGAVVALGAQNGIPVPTNRMIAQFIRLAESNACFRATHAT